MFGIGAGEMMVILILLLIAVGPDKMPTVVKAVSKGVKEFRRTTRELRSTVGIDELLNDEDFRDPLGMKQPIKPRPPRHASDVPTPRPMRESELDEAELLQENPPEGVDVLAMRAAEEPKA
jgi:Sec-independent protein translocase protein TatA